MLWVLCKFIIMIVMASHIVKRIESKEQMPPRNEIILVEEGEFGYLSPETEEKYLATIGLINNIGLYGKERNRELEILAHLNNYFGSFSLQIEKMIESLKRGNLSKGVFDKAVILATRDADDKTIKNVRKKLKRIEKARRIDIYITDVIPLNVIVDRNGDILEFYERDFPYDSEFDDGHFEEISRIASPYIRCANDRKKFMLGQAICQGVGKVYHLVDEFGVYGITIPMPPNYLENFYEDFERLENMGIKVVYGLDQNGKNYVTLLCEGYLPEEDKKVVSKINEEARRLIEKMGIISH